MAKRRVVILFFMAAAAHLFALDPHKEPTQYVYLRWFEEDGLLLSTARKMVQTRDGYLWIGNTDGLARFDGHHFSHFDKQNTPALKSSYVHALFQDREGRLWVGTAKGLVSYRNGVFQDYDQIPGAPDGQIFAAAQTQDGLLWFASNKGLVQFSNNRFTLFGEKQGLPSSHIRSLVTSGDGQKLWVGTLGGLCAVAYDGPHLSILVESQFSSSRIWNLFSDRSGFIWVDSENGLFRCKEGQIEEMPLAVSGDNRLTALVEDQSGAIWLSVWGKGVYVYRGGMLKKTQLPGLTDTTIVAALLEDMEGNLWVGTLSAGLHCYLDGAFTTYSVEEGLVDNMARAIYQDAQDRYWIGTEGGISLFDQGQFTSFTEASGLTSNRIQTFGTAPDGRILVGTLGGGLMVYENEAFRPFYPDIGKAGVISIKSGRQGGLWIGTFGDGIFHYDGRKWRQYSTRDGLSSPFILFLHEDEQGRLWIGTQTGGLNILKNGQFRHIRKADGLLSDGLFAFYMDEEGAAWIATEGQGINRIKDEKIAAITTKNGLLDDFIFAFVPDNFGQLWMSSNFGIFSVEKSLLDDVADGRLSRFDSRVFGKVDGLKNQECNHGGDTSGMRDKNGNIWFVTAKGVTTARPQDIKKEKAPKVMLEDVLVDGKSVGHSAPMSFKGDISTIEFHYTALKLSDAGITRFRVMLEGKDKDWIDQRHARFVRYSGLKAGEYQLQIQAYHPQGNWPTETLNYRFVIRTNYMRLAAVLSGLILLLALIAATLFRLRVRRLEKREHTLEKLVSERTRALEDSKRHLIQTQERLVSSAHKAGMAEIATNVLHNIGNAMNSVNVSSNIMARTVNKIKPEFLMRVMELLEEHKDDLHQFLTQDPKGLKVINTLKAFARNLSQEKQRLNEEIISLNDLVQEINNIIRAQQALATGEDLYQRTDLNELVEEAIAEQIHSSESHGIHFHKDLEKLPQAFVQKFKLLKVLKHLLSNACEAYESQSVTQTRVVSIQTHLMDEERVCIRINDQGCGIDPLLLEKVFNQGFSTKPFGEGFGLHLAANIMKEMQGTIELTSQGHNQGTTVIIEFPLAPSREMPDESTLIRWKLEAEAFPAHEL